MNKQYEYDMSVIIPVYNAEQFLEHCIDSVLKQSYDSKKIEIVLINDGSIDNSLQICNKYAKKHDNVKVFDQENGGVSRARNKGLKEAQGKYIMFLDSDDYLKSNTIKNLVNFFDEHYDEVDLVTYPIFHDYNGKIVIHSRYKTLYKKGTYVYDIETFPRIIQTTINTCIKNEKDKLPSFKLNQPFSEDERFNTEIIMRKKKIGYVKEAGYYWRANIYSTSNNKANPLYCFEEVISYYEELLEKYTDENNEIPEYIENLFLNTFYWRTNRDQMLPYSYDKKEFDKAVERVDNLVKKISINSIASHTKLSVYAKMRMLEIKGEKVNIDYYNEKFHVKCFGNSIYARSAVTFSVRRFYYNNNTLSFFGIVMSPIVCFDGAKLYMKVTDKNGNVKEEKIKLYNSNILKKRCDYYQSIIYNVDMNIDVTNVKEISFFAKYKELTIPVKLYFERINVNFVQNGKFLQNKDGSIYIKNAVSLTTVKYYLKKSIETLFTYPKLWIYSILSLFILNKNTYLYTDRDDLINNAYYQFKYDVAIKDKVHRYYITSLDKERINNYFTKEEQKHLVKLRSLKHKLLMFKANKIFSSFSDRSVYNPLLEYKKCFNKYKKFELIYLQHGILHASLQSMYSKDFTDIDKFIISSDFEKENLINNYNYSESDLVPSTMPINVSEDFNIENSTRTKKRIVLAPSWRKYLIGDLVKGEREPKTAKFKESSFYKEICNIFNSKEFNEFLEKNNTEVIFQLHPIFKVYNDLFPYNENIKPSEEDLNVHDCDLFITDFSSFQFDFIKLKKPILYFMPDKKEFDAGLHTYRKLDLNNDKSFGTFTYNYKDCIEEIKKIVNNGFKPDKEYLKRMDDFFYKVDNPCAVIYDYVERKNRK